MDDPLKRISLKQEVFSNKLWENKVAKIKYITCHRLNICIYSLLPFHFSIMLLKISRFWDNLMWYGRLFRIFGPKILRLFFTNVTWFHLRTSRFSLYLSRTSPFIFFKIKNFIHELWINFIDSFVNFNTQNFPSADIHCNFPSFEK